MKKTLNLGNDKLLLFDDIYVENKRNVTLVLNELLRYDDPVIAPDQPWEIGGIFGDSNVSVIQEEGIIRLWYAIEYLKPEKRTKRSRNEILPGEFGNLDEKTLADLRGADRKYALCCATSTDGIHWKKPHVNIISYGGNKKNNMLFIDRLGCTVFKDPSAPPKERYKMIYGSGPRLEHVHLVENIPTPPIYHAVYGAVSSDGIHWKPYPKPIIPWYTDTTNVAYYDESSKQYVAHIRSNEGMIYQNGKTVTPDKGARLRFRAIGQATSKKFQRFPAPVRILEPTIRERRNYDKGVDYYNTSALKYPFAPNTYFFFSSFFYHEPDMLDVHLCTSRDGVHYTVFPKALLGLGLEGSFDSHSTYMATGIVRKRDELYMYYAGYNHTHRGATRKPYAGGIGLARIRLDGFVSQDFGSNGGTLTTTPLTFQGKFLSLNMNAPAGSCLKVEILDQKGNEIPEYSLTKSDFLWGNNVAKIVSWQGNTDVSRLAGKPIRLRFRGKGVKLYAFQFVNKTQSVKGECV